MKIARMLLLAAAGDTQAEFLLGDLEEEFSLVCERRGRFAGRRWYAWQALRSLMPLFAMRIRGGELTAVLLRAVLGVTLPLLLLDRLWSFVYSQIPLKDGISRAPEYLALNVLCLLTCTAATKTRATAATLAAGLALVLSTGATPAIYVGAILLAASASALITHAWRKSE